MCRTIEVIAVRVVKGLRFIHLSCDCEVDLALYEETVRDNPIFQSRGHCARGEVAMEAIKDIAVKKCTIYTVNTVTITPGSLSDFLIHTVIGHGML